MGLLGIVYFIDELDIIGKEVELILYYRPDEQMLL